MSVRFDRPVAHRGLHDRSHGIVENSASAFAAAIAKGYAIECDLQLTADGMPVVFHDATLQRLTGHTGYTRDHTAAYVTSLPLAGSAAGDRPQTLAELLGQVAGRTQLVIELKQQATRAAAEQLAGAVAAAIRAYNGPVVLESFDPFLVRRVQERGCGCPSGIVTHAWRDASDPEAPNALGRFALRHLLHWPRSHFTFISCHHADLDLAAVRLARALGIPVTAWTVRDQQTADKIAPHVDQIVFEGFIPRS